VTYLAEKEIKALLRVQHQRLAEPPLSLQITSSPERGMAEKKGKKIGLHVPMDDVPYCLHYLLLTTLHWQVSII